MLSDLILADRNRAFELFRKSYRKNDVIEENKAILRSKYDEAKGEMPMRVYNPTML